MENPQDADVDDVEMDDPILQEGGHIAGGHVPMDANDIPIMGDGDDMQVDAVQPNGVLVQDLGGPQLVAAHIPGGQVAVNGGHIAGVQVPMNAANGDGIQVDAVQPNGPVVGGAHIPGGEVPFNGGHMPIAGVQIALNGGEVPIAGGHDNADVVEVDAVPQMDQDLGAGNVAAVPPAAPVIEDHEGNILHGVQAILFAAAALVTHHAQEMLGLCDMLNELGLDLQVDGTVLNEFAANFNQHALNMIEQTLAQIQDTLANLIAQREEVNDAAAMLQQNFEQGEILGEAEDGLGHEDPEDGLGDEDPEAGLGDQDPEAGLGDQDPEEENLGEAEAGLGDQDPEEENVEEVEHGEENLGGLEPGEGGQENNGIGMDNDINAIIDAGQTIINSALLLREEVQELGATAAAAMNNLNLQVHTILNFLAQMDDIAADIQNAAAIAAQARANILAEGNEVQGNNLQAGHDLQPVELPQADHGVLPLVGQPQAVHPGNIVADVPQGHLPGQLPENPLVELQEAGEGDLQHIGLPQAVQPGNIVADVPQGHLLGQLPENPLVELPEAGQGDLQHVGLPQAVQPGNIVADIPQGHLPGQMPENPPVELPEAGHGDLPDAGLPQVEQMEMANLHQDLQHGQLPENHDGTVINGEVHHGDNDDEDD